MDKKDILETLNTRAVNRGFSSLNHAMDFLNTSDLEALYIVVKKYSLKDIFDGCKAISAKTNKTSYWYKNCWTKTIVLAGDPSKLTAKFAFFYATENVGFIGPLLQSSKEAKKLTTLLPQLNTSSEYLEKYKSVKNAKCRFIFNNLNLSLGKFIVQLVHMIVEIDKDVAITEEPSIEMFNSLEQLENSKYTYLRIDGGKTEIAPYTHVATGIMI